MYLLIDDADNTNVVKDTLYQNFTKEGQFAYLLFSMILSIDWKIRVILEKRIYIYRMVNSCDSRRKRVNNSSGLSHRGSTGRRRR